MQTNIGQAMYIYLPNTMLGECDPINGRIFCYWWEINRAKAISTLNLQYSRTPITFQFSCKYNPHYFQYSRSENIKVRYQLSGLLKQAFSLSLPTMKISTAIIVESAGRLQTFETTRKPPDDIFNKDLRLNDIFHPPVLIIKSMWKHDSPKY